MNRKNHYRSYGLTHMKVPRLLFERLTHDFPALKHSRSKRRLMMLLLMMPITDEHDNKIPVINHQTVAWCEEQNPASNGYTSGLFLEDFSRTVYPLGTLEWNFTKGRARALNPVPNCDEYGQLLGVPTDDYVDFVTGSRWGHQSVLAFRLARNEAREFIGRTYQDHPAYPAMIYLNSQHARRYRPCPNGLEQTWAALGDMVGTEAHQTARHNIHHLRLLTTQPPSTPIFHPSVREATSRIFSSSPITQLSSEFRLMLYPEWIDLDLASSQLAIVSVLWGAKGIEQYLRAGNSFWDGIFAHLGCDRTAKPMLKDALYATTYGKRKRNVVKDGMLSQEMAKSFFSYPIIAELVEARDRQMAAVREHGGAVDCFGKRIPYITHGRDDNVRSILSEVAQAYELAMILPAFEYAADRRDITIVLFQHDGFSVTVSDPRRSDSIIAGIQRVVDRRCAELGFPTRLEVKH